MASLYFYSKAIFQYTFLFLLAFASATPTSAQVFDPNFGNLGLARLEVPNNGYEVGYELLLQADQKIIQFGLASTSAGVGTKRLLMARYDLDGELDKTFAEVGYKAILHNGSTSTYYHSAALQSDQKILLGAYCWNCRFVERYDQHGNLDETFANGGRLDFYDEDAYHDDFTIRVLENDDFLLIRRKKVLTDVNHSYSLHRFFADGNVDESFGENGMVNIILPTTDAFFVYNFILHDEETILVSGSVSYTDDYGEVTSEFALMRWKIDGTVDTTFGVNGLTTNPIGAAQDMAVQADGKILCVGSIGTNPQGTAGNMIITRYTANGILDLSFSDDGHQFVDIDSYADYANAVVVQEDGKILVGGTFFNFAGGTGTDCALVRLLPDGSFDVSFGEEGVFEAGVANGTDRVIDMKIQGGNKLVFGGHGNFQNFDMITARIVLDGQVVSGDQDLCLGENKTLLAYTDAEVIGWAEASAPDVLISTSPFVTVSPIVNTTYLFYTNLDTTSATLTIISAPTVELPADVTLCPDEELTLDVSFPEATYVWQDGATQAGYTISESGTYWVDVSNQCGTVRDSQEVTVVDLSFVNLGPDTAICQPEQLMIGFSKEGYIYNWQDGSMDSIFTVTDTGEYWVEVTSEGCSATDSIVVDFLPTSNTSLSITYCEDYPSPSGNYLWTESGTYQDTLSNQLGCDSILTIELTILELDTLITLNENVITAAVAGQTYQWYDCNGGLYPIEGETNQDFNVTASGSYALEVINGNCNQFSSCIDVIISNTTTIAENKFTVYPNPTSDILQIQTATDQSKQFIIYNLQGQVVLSKTMSKKNHQISLSDLVSGCYVLEIRTGDEIEYHNIVRI